MCLYACIRKKKKKKELDLRIFRMYLYLEKKTQGIDE